MSRGREFGQADRKPAVDTVTAAWRVQSSRRGGKTRVICSFRIARGPLRYKCEVY